MFVKVLPSGVVEVSSDTSQDLVIDVLNEVEETTEEEVSEYTTEEGDINA